MKRLSWEEMQKKRAQGLCFNCEEKFTPGHRCKGPQLLLLEACGVCHSDLHVIKDEIPFPSPCAIGHEITG
uniref:Alcohol dehydrogenase-like N-terminal domain-containing protein n=1 Tax=Salix viminalis TaxID=40686 RepID=A0A6N2LI86_SALVM